MQKALDRKEIEDSLIADEMAEWEIIKKELELHRQCLNGYYDIRSKTKNEAKVLEEKLSSYRYSYGEYLRSGALVMFDNKDDSNKLLAVADFFKERVEVTLNLVLETLDAISESTEKIEAQKKRVRRFETMADQQLKYAGTLVAKRGGFYKEGERLMVKMPEWN